MHFGFVLTVVYRTVCKFDCNGIDVMLPPFFSTDYFGNDGAADGRRTIVGNVLLEVVRGDDVYRGGER